MTNPSRNDLRWIALFGCALIISVFFLFMVRSFLISALMAAIISALAAPMVERLAGAFGGRKGLAAALMLVMLFILVIGPILGVVFMIAQQSEGVIPQANRLVEEIRAATNENPVPDWIPFAGKLSQYSAEITAKLGEFVEMAGRLFASSLSGIAKGTSGFFLDLFIFLYALFLFLKADHSAVNEALRFTGLPEEVQKRAAQRMLSVSRATIKGTVVIGLVQGALGGLGFWIAGIESPAFWGAVMVLLSLVPGVGPLLIILGGAAWLLLTGDTTAGVALAVWGVAVVGTVDNIMRPVLVGKDSEMPDLVTLLSTLGGLASFGAAGLVIGPVLAALFLMFWELISHVGSEQGTAPES